MLKGFKVDASHQEIERILGEVEAWYQGVNQNCLQMNGEASESPDSMVEWLPLKGIENFLFNDLGYEDVDEFEDAIHAPFQEFLGNFPHIEVKEIEEKWYLKVHELPAGKPRKLVLTVSSAKQLVETTFLHDSDATLDIPSIEFRMGGDNKRRIDLLYQHIANAKSNLEKHAEMVGPNGKGGEEILETCLALSTVLDVEEPFEIVVRDPRGRCEFLPDTGVREEELDADEEEPASWNPEAKEEGGA